MTRTLLKVKDYEPLFLKENLTLQVPLVYQTAGRATLCHIKPNCAERAVCITDMVPLVKQALSRIKGIYELQVSKSELIL